MKRSPGNDNTPGWRLRNNNDDSWNLEVSVLNEFLGELYDLKDIFEMYNSEFKNEGTGSLYKRTLRRRKYP